MKRFLQLAVFALCLAPTAAVAHVGVGSTSGFAHGFMHPLSGLDHQLAMILVGLFAYQLGGRALWLVPLTFVSVMALGGFLGVMGVPIPFVEVGIALSVVVLGAIVAIGVRAPLAVAMGAVGTLRYLSRPRSWLRDAAGCFGLRIWGRLHAGHGGTACGRHRHRLPHRYV
jgi:urease accessory protein